MHYEIDPDKSHLKEIEVGLYGEGFGQGNDKRRFPGKGHFSIKCLPGA